MKVVKLTILIILGCMFFGCSSKATQPTKITSAPIATTQETTAPLAPEPDKIIALTFDDGPSTKTMAQVLDILKKYNAKATFFVIGRKITDTTKPVLQRAVDEGHEIGNHSMNHLKMAELTEEEILSEYENCHQAVLDAVGVEMYYFRAPYGSIDDRMYQIIQAPFIGSAISSGDGTIGSIAADRAWKVTSKAYDGAIVTFHCFQGNDETVIALETVLPELIAQGYKFVTVSELYAERGYPVPTPTPGVKFKDNAPIE